MSDAPTPSGIQLHTASRILELAYGDSEHYALSCEYLRVHSPSAEVKGHGPGQKVLQVGKINVGISEILPVGNYALQFIFTDGHDSGIYSWRYLYELCQNQQAYWQDYLQQLKQANASRDPDVQVVQLFDGGLK
jgi:DUF971 family protein